MDGCEGLVLYIEGHKREKKEKEKKERKEGLGEGEERGKK